MQDSIFAQVLSYNMYANNRSQTTSTVRCIRTREISFGISSPFGSVTPNATSADGQVWNTHRRRGTSLIIDYMLSAAVTFTELAELRFNLVSTNVHQN